MKIGMSFDGFSPFGDALTFAREAVEAGAGSLWMADHLGYRDPMLSCLAFALATKDARVVPTAVSPYLRHPMPTAMQLATLAEAAPGRAEIALGVGNPLFLAESGESMDKPIRVIREFVAALRALLSGEPVHMEALRFKLAGARMMFKPSAPIPIYLAPIKDQMLKLSGKIADGVVLSAGLTSEFTRRSLAVVRAGTEEAGRDYGAIRTSSYISFLAAPDHGAAITRIKKQLSFLLRNKFLQENIALSGIPIDQEAIVAAMSARDFETAQRLVPDHAAERFAVAGTVRECCDRLQQYTDAGLQELVLLMAGTQDDQRYGLRVIRELSSHA
jgi:alkanesulfonate monooxygenase SsuD/methylene tetrahydromethanopterin reductase-like flavin-dependent oxidoreductase (luciferase family)